MRSKRQDPLHVLLEYIATVSTADECYIFNVNSNLDGAAVSRLRYGPRA